MNLTVLETIIAGVGTESQPACGRGFVGASGDAVESIGAVFAGASILESALLNVCAFPLVGVSAYVLGNTDTIPVKALTLPKK